jgi:YD repeat-containing protein
MGSGGSTNVSGTSTGVGGSSQIPKFDPVMTADCPIWPIEKTVPWVGMFFFGPDPGPCSETWSGETSHSVFTYDAQGRVTNLTTESAEYEYLYDGAKLMTVTSNGVKYGQYAYTSSTVTYVTGTTESNGYTAVWELDDRGYPRRVTVDLHSTATLAPDETYLYQYEDCRLVRRIAEPSTATRTDNNWTYTYDAYGHIVHVDITDGRFYDEDYSCW